VYLLSLFLQFALGLAIIFLVLIHSGRGGGLSDMFGGGLGASASASTVMEKNLDRLTVVISIAFAFNTLVLSFLIDK
jgi:preprotein translocase subunit SecG